MLIEASVIQPQLVSPRTVYIVLICGDATGLETWALSKPAGGNQVNEVQLVCGSNW